MQKNPLTKHIYTSNSFRYNQIDEEFGMSKDIQISSELKSDKINNLETVPFHAHQNSGKMSMMIPRKRQTSPIYKQNAIAQKNLKA